MVDDGYWISIHFLQAGRYLAKWVLVIYMPKSSSKREDNDLDKV